MRILFVLLFTMPALLKAQENPLDIFKPLENYTWSAKGKWIDGSSFKQEIKLEFALTGNLVKVESKGFVNKEQTKTGIRNHGIRQYDKKTGEIRFWEFDIFGTVTEGTVKAKGKDLIYKYDYDGTLVTEMWIYKNEKTYDYIVGIYDNDDWVNKFLETEFKRKKK